MAMGQLAGLSTPVTVGNFTTAGLGPSSGKLILQQQMAFQVHDDTDSSNGVLDAVHNDWVTLFVGRRKSSSGMTVVTSTVSPEW